MIDINLTTEEMRSRAVLLENRQWFDENIEELQKGYKNKIIAVHGRRVVASGQTLKEVKEAVKDKFPQGEALVIMVPGEPILKHPYPE